MLFKPELIEKIVAGEKTQTRRPVKAGESLCEVESPHGGYKPPGMFQNNRAKVMVGQDYAVQPGRGKPGVLWHPNTKVIITSDAHQLVVAQTGTSLTEGFIPLRIRVLNIRREDVRNISPDDAMAEGFETRTDFWNVWCGFYDPGALPDLNHHIFAMERAFLNKRPDALYQAWAYTFEVVR